MTYGTCIMRRQHVHHCRGLQRRSYMVLRTAGRLNAVPGTFQNV